MVIFVTKHGKYKITRVRSSKMFIFCRHPLASSPHVNVMGRMRRFPSETVLLCLPLRQVGHFHPLPVQVFVVHTKVHRHNASLLFKKKTNELICGNKMPTRCNRGFIAELIACSTCFGRHYAHHQELKSIIRWLLPVVFRAVVFKLLFWCAAEGYVSGLQDAAASCKPDT